MYDYFINALGFPAEPNEIVLKGAVILICIVGYFVCLSLYSLFFKR